jgi:hypothetical protein
MPDFFLRPYPDELLVSVLARNTTLMRYPLHRGWCQDLFGEEHAKYRVIHDFLGNMGALCKRLNYSDEIKEHWLYDHTLFPYFSPFVNLGFRDALLRFMVGSLETTPKHIRAQACHYDYLRYCIDCVQEDRAIYGEAYWHRVHQICTVCPHHLLPIQNSSVVKWHRDAAHTDLITAEAGLVNATQNPTVPVITGNDFSKLIHLNQDILWLLNHGFFKLDIECVSKRLHTLLITNGFLTADGRLRTKEFKSALCDYYSETLFQELGLSFDSDPRYAWTTFAVREDNKISRNPREVLLVIQFFGHTMASFLDVATSYEHFGSGPWKCQNPVCPDYNQRSISENELRIIHHLVLC